jgi:LAO/AO transport system kinase
VEVAEVADLVLVILAPGQGDGIQLLKCGLLEAGDIFVVNKADQEGADRLAAQLLATLHLAGGERRPGHPEEVLTVSALKGRGVAELIDLLEKRCEQERDRWRKRRSLAVEEEVRLAVLEEARRRILRTLGNNEAAAEQVRRVLRGETTVTGLVGTLLDKVAREQGAGSEQS